MDNWIALSTRCCCRGIWGMSWKSTDKI